MLLKCPSCCSACNPLKTFDNLLNIKCDIGVTVESLKPHIKQERKRKKIFPLSKLQQLLCSAHPMESQDCQLPDRKYKPFAEQLKTWVFFL